MAPAPNKLTYPVRSILVAGATVAWALIACSDDAELERVDEFDGEYRTVGTLKNGKKHGEWLLLRPNGRVWQLDLWKDGHPHGVSRSWHENGHLESDSPYSHGRADGRWRIFYDDGQIAAIGWTRRGKRKGIQCDWEPDGRVERIAEYFDDRLMKEEMHPGRPCPVTVGNGRRHRDPANTEYGVKPLGRRRR